MEILDAGRLEQIVKEEGAMTFLFMKQMLLDNVREEEADGSPTHVQCPTCQTWLPNRNPMHHTSHTPANGGFPIAARFCTRCETVFVPETSDYKPAPDRIIK